MLADYAYIGLWCICVFVEHRAPSSTPDRDPLVAPIR